LNTAIRTLFATLIALASSLAAAQAEDPQLRKEIQQVYTRWDKAAAAGDVDTMISMIDPSFVAIDKNGKVTNYADARKQFQGIFKTIKDPKSKITVNQIQEQGDEVVAWITMTVSFKAKQGDKWAPVSFTAKFAETLKRVGGQWKFVLAQELP